MLRLRNLLVVLAVLVMLPSQALGQAATIKFVNNPYWSGDDVAADGEFTVAKGFTRQAITLYVVNPNGGRGGQAVCTVDTNKTPPTWSGKALNIPNAAYKVFARITVRADGTTTDLHFDTKFVDLKPKKN